MLDKIRRARARATRRKFSAADACAMARVWIGVGILGCLAAQCTGRALRTVRAGRRCIAYGVFLLVASRMKSENAFTTILGEMESMSASMRWLALVQFCSWFTLFAIFVYTAPAVAQLHFGARRPGSPAYEAGANWVGVLFATYNGLGALAATDHSLVRAALRHSHDPPDQSVAGRRRPAVDAVDPRSRLAAGVDDRTRLRLGVHHFAALRDAGQQPAVAEDGRQHRDLQHLHRDPAVARRRP